VSAGDREVETRIGRALLARNITRGAIIRVGVTDGELAISCENQASSVSAPEEPQGPAAQD
jgi:hypothetical protein